MMFRSHACVLRLIAVILFVQGVSGAAPVERDTAVANAGPASVATDVLTVAGQVLLRDDAPFIVQGLQVTGFVAPPNLIQDRPAYLNARRAFGPELLAVAKTWNANTIRFQIGQSGLDPEDPAFSQDFVTDVENGVRLARQMGFVVIASIQNRGPSTRMRTKQLPARDLPLPDESTKRALLSLVRMFGHDRGIMLELFNEPHLVGTPPEMSPDENWALWRDGGTVARGKWRGFQFVGANQLIKAAREAGAENVLVAEGIQEQFLGWSSDLVDPLHLVVYSFHPYRDNFLNQESWTRRFGEFAESHPVIASEWHAKTANRKWCAVAAMDNPLRLLRYMRSRRIGLVGFALDWPGTLVSDFQGTPTILRACGDPGDAGELVKQLFTTGALPGASAPP